MLSFETLPSGQYRGRLAPSPTGWLHLGHARTFWTAFTRCQAAGGVLILREEDLDRSRVRPEFSTGLRQDLHWLGLNWQEGPDCGGPVGPYLQSGRLAQHRQALARLHALGLIYPCHCSREDVRRAISAPHADGDEPVYPGTCRCRTAPLDWQTNWRFRVPDGDPVRFVDGHFGPKCFVAGSDFGDFVVWRSDGFPSYQLACAADDAAMGITEVVRGADLLRSTARQLLLYAALDWTAPKFCHCPLMTDTLGVRLAKRHDALALRTLRERGLTPEALRQQWES